MDVGEPQPFIYRAKTENIIDAQTIQLSVDLGFRIQNTIYADLVGVEAHQRPIEDADKQSEADHHIRFVRSWIKGNRLDTDSEWPLKVRTFLPRHDCSQGDYGVMLFSADTNECLNDDLKGRFPDLST